MAKGTACALSETKVISTMCHLLGVRWLEGRKAGSRPALPEHMDVTYSCFESKVESDGR